MFLDFSDVSLSDSAGGALPLGVYPATVKSATFATTAAGASQVEFVLTLTDERYAGIERRTWINLQASSPDKQKGLLQVWGAAFMSIGIDAATLKGYGQIPVDQIPGIFTGRECFIEHDPGNQDLGVRMKVGFLKPAAYEARRAAQEAAGGPGHGQPAAAPVAAPAARTVAVPAAPAAPAAFAAPVAVAVPAVAVAAPAAGPVVAPAPAAAATAGAPNLASLLRRK